MILTPNTKKVFFAGLLIASAMLLSRLKECSDNFGEHPIGSAVWSDSSFRIEYGTIHPPKVIYDGISQNTTFTDKATKKKIPPKEARKKPLEEVEAEVSFDSTFVSVMNVGPLEVKDSLRLKILYRYPADSLRISVVRSTIPYETLRQNIISTTVLPPPQKEPFFDKVRDYALPAFVAGIGVALILR